MKKINLTYKHTTVACFAGYIVQAVINNFVPLLFLTFESDYGIPLSKITLLVTINFAIQLTVDLLSASLIDKIGYRVSVMAADALSCVGLIFLAVLPEAIPDPYVGLLIAVAVYAVGGGLLEVLVSPIVESCPTENKETTMSLLHSFYCWGHVGVVLLSTLFFTVFGTENWRILALIWAIVPALNLIMFRFVPMYSLGGEGERGLKITELFKLPTFWLMMLLMFAAGASEQAVSQWASAFAEAGLGVSKTVGDLCGPLIFAFFMGSSRALYGKFGGGVNIKSMMLGSSALCIMSYLVISLSPWAAVSLVGCGICGFSVGILWPGSFSISSSAIRGGGTALFAFLALAGDLGCTVGPTFVGLVSSAAGSNLRIGILAAVLFPTVMLAGVLLLKNRGKSQGKR